MVLYLGCIQADYSKFLTIGRGCGGSILKEWTKFDKHKRMIEVSGRHTPKQKDGVPKVQGLTWYEKNDPEGSGVPWEGLKGREVPLVKCMTIQFVVITTRLLMTLETVTTNSYQSSRGEVALFIQTRSSAILTVKAI